MNKKIIKKLVKNPKNKLPASPMKHLNSLFVVNRLKTNLLLVHISNNKIKLKNL